MTATRIELNFILSYKLKFRGRIHEKVEVSWCTPSCRGEEITVPSFLTSAKDGVCGHLHTSAASPQANTSPPPL
jgi:hypothetical protein